MNVQLLEELLDYFKLNRWRKTRGLTKVPPFDKWPNREVQAHILAMAKVGILEKHKSTTTKNALFRLSLERALWWKTTLEDVLRDGHLLRGMDFRTTYILFVIGMYYLENGRPPRQRELFYVDDHGNFMGLINEWLEESGASAEDPTGISGPPHIQQATRLLAQLGYMTERGEKGDRRPYFLTERGLELVHQLRQKHWRDWFLLQS